MIPVLVVAAYLALVLYVGIFAFRKSKGTGEDYFVASRALGPYVFLLALFGTNMTAFAILGSSGLAYQRGIGVYGLMASASGFVIPLTLFFIGTRLWALGKRHGYMTQVQFFRERWECSAIGTVIFALTAAMLVPYIIIGVMGGGHTLEALTTVLGPDGKPALVEVVRDGRTLLETQHWVSYELGGAVVALVVMTYVFFGGMRGTAWVNALQTSMFLLFGTLAFVLIALRLKDKAGIFELAIRFAFSGFAALAPIMLAALFWKRSTKWGALAATLWVLAAMLGTWYLHETSANLAPKMGQPLVPIFPELGNLLLRSPGNVLMYGFLPVLPMCLGSALLMVLGSLLTRPPSAATLEKFFPSDQRTASTTEREAELPKLEPLHNRE